MASPLKRKLRGRVKATRKDDIGLEKQLQEFALDGNVDAIMGFVLQHKSNFDTIVKGLSVVKSGFWFLHNAR